MIQRYYQNCPDIIVVVVVVVVVAFCFSESILIQRFNPVLLHNSFVKEEEE